MNHLSLFTLHGIWKYSNYGISSVFCTDLAQILPFSLIQIINISLSAILIQTMFFLASFSGKILLFPQCLLGIVLWPWPIIWFRKGKINVDAECDADEGNCGKK